MTQTQSLAERLKASLIHYTIRWLIIMGMSVVVIFIGWRLLSLYGELPESAPADPQAKILFDSLQKQKLLEMSASGTVTLPAKDTALALKAVSNGGNATMIKNVEELIDELYYSAPGKRVQQQIDVWNQTRNLSAVRDNSQGNNPANIWQAYDDLGHAVQASKNSQVPLEFGFINKGRLPQYFGQWLSIGHHDKTVIFKKHFDLKKAKTVSIDVIGTPNVSHLGSFSAQTHKRTDTKQIQCTQRSAVAYRVVLNLPVGEHEITLPVVPTHNPVALIDGLAISYGRKKTDNPKCYRYLTSPQLVWNNDTMNTGASKRSIGIKNSAKISIQTADGSPLVAYNPDLQATDKTVELGLLPLIGQDKYDYYSLTGMSRGLQKNTQMTLTIDSRLQTAQLKILKKYQNSGKNASLVMVNVKTGDILSAVGVPLAKNNVSLWDRNSFSKIYPQIDPYNFLPWQGLGKNNAPGSIFKLVTSIALIRASEDNSTIKKAIYGMSAGQLHQLGIPTAAGVKWQSAFEGVPPVKNYGSHGGYGMKQMVFSPVCGDVQKNREAKLSLLDIIGKSYNTWFAGLTEIMDREALEGMRESILAKTAQDFGFDNVFSLSPTEIPFKRVLPEKNNIGLYKGRGDVLNAFGGQMDYTTKMRAVPATQLSRLSFGQSAATTPLTMALVSASIAKGEFVQPKLFLKLNGDEIDENDFNDLDIDDDDLDFLRLAMKGVVQRGGTAQTAFKPLIKKGGIGCRTHAKTGTSDSRGGAKNAWMTGYIDDKQGKPEVAFACMVQEAQEGGGKECGPLVVKMLKNYEKTMHSTTQTNQ